jgi:hypothetical protein
LVFLLRKHWEYITEGEIVEITPEIHPVAQKNLGEWERRKPRTPGKRRVNGPGFPLEKPRGRNL